MIDRSGPAADAEDHDRDLADLRAELERLRRDLGDLGGTLRTLATHKLDTAGARLRAGAAEGKTRLLARMSDPPERLTGIAFCIGVAAGLLLRARRNA